MKALLRRKKMANSRYICVNCLKVTRGAGTCHCQNRLVATFNYRGRPPKKDAHKKEWKQFIVMFLSYEPEMRDKALKTLENR